MVGKISKINNRGDDYLVHQSNSRNEAKLSLYLHIGTNTKLQIHCDRYVEKHKQIPTLIGNLKETLRDTQIHSQRHDHTSMGAHKETYTQWQQNRNGKTLIP